MSSDLHERHTRLSNRFWELKETFEFWQRTSGLQYQVLCGKLMSELSDPKTSSDRKTDIGLELMDLNWIRLKAQAYLERKYVEDLKVLQRDFTDLASNLAM